jgi:hypothetical protein
MRGKKSIRRRIPTSPGIRSPSFLDGANVSPLQDPEKFFTVWEGPGGRPKHVQRSSVGSEVAA